MGYLQSLLFEEVDSFGVKSMTLENCEQFLKLVVFKFFFAYTCTSFINIAGNFKETFTAKERQIYFYK